MIEEKLSLTEKSLTAHFGRRSGAVTLASASMSMPNLKQADRWASTLAVEEYMKHNHASKKECLTLLDTKKESSVRKESEHDDSNDSSSNNSDYYSKTDQMEETAPSTLPAAMLCNNKQ
eukprot:3620510-Ditylum_brightwellii.AAC.1